MPHRRGGRRRRPGAELHEEQARAPRFWGPVGAALARCEARGDAQDPLRSERANLSIVLRLLAGSSDAAREAVLSAAAERHATPQALRGAVVERRRHALARLGAEKQGVRRKATSVWNVVVGGTETATELRVVLHPTHGFPVLPGSALKGAARAASGGGEAFGTAESRGNATVLDALPLGDVALVRDVLTPHFAPYHDDPANPPGEFWNPVPAGFVAVPSGTEFEIVVLARRGHGEDARSMSQALAEALESRGLGGKTAAGYGYFRVEDEAA